MRQRAGTGRSKARSQRAHHCPPSRCRRSYSSRNLARSKPPGSSGTRCSQASLARRRSRSAGVSVRACACACPAVAALASPAQAPAACARAGRRRRPVAPWRRRAWPAAVALAAGLAGLRGLVAARSCPAAVAVGDWPGCCCSRPAGCPAARLAVSAAGPACDCPAVPGGGLRFIAASTARLLAIASAMPGCCRSACVVGGDGVVVPPCLRQRIAAVVMGVGAVSSRRSAVPRARSRPCDRPAAPCSMRACAAWSGRRHGVPCTCAGCARQHDAQHQHDHARTTAAEREQRQQHQRRQQPVALVLPAARRPPRFDRSLGLLRIEHAERAQVGGIRASAPRSGHCRGGERAQRGRVQPRWPIRPSRSRYGAPAAVPRPNADTR